MNTPSYFQTIFFKKQRINFAWSYVQASIIEMQNTMEVIIFLWQSEKGIVPAVWLIHHFSWKLIFFHLQNMFSFWLDCFKPDLQALFCGGTKSCEPSHIVHLMLFLKENFKGCAMTAPNRLGEHAVSKHRLHIGRMLMKKSIARVWTFFYLITFLIIMLTLYQVMFQLTSQ